MYKIVYDLSYFPPDIVVPIKSPDHIPAYPFFVSAFCAY